MPTRNINLTEHFDRYLSEALASGRYSNASEVVRAGLRLLENEEQQEQARLVALRSAFREGQAAIERGALATMESDADIDDFFDEIERQAPQA